ncbi:hypothetical protein BT96DRAFT_1001201 [Gymnopus androsaceus JB14]|uniref:F-box domain-containing protein n=1 Tax=Gymnopus androsaceus JB14 TaxID=1447944 RepID=A0A6A4H005_9AGAR|nr:hypothetical protein BT96DRAFT_1001201 [Gymnopus androsaceus JB14]
MDHESSKNLNDCKTDLHSLPISSFEQLPNEILCVIFELACTDNLLQQHPWPIWDIWSGNLAISAICTRWRFLALASLRLWSQLRMEIAPKGQAMSNTQSRFLSTLQLYLDRSADSPLLVDLQTSRALDEDEVLLEHTLADIQLYW